MVELGTAGLSLEGRADQDTRGVICRSSPCFSNKGLFTQNSRAATPFLPHPPTHIPKSARRTLPERALPTSKAVGRNLFRGHKKHAGAKTWVVGWAKKEKRSSKCAFNTAER